MPTTLKLRVTCSTEDGEVIESDLIEVSIPDAAHPVQVAQNAFYIPAEEASHLARRAFRVLYNRANRPTTVGD